MHRETGGIPRLINSVATRSLMAAFLAEKHLVQPAHLRDAMNSLNLNAGRSRSHIYLRPSLSLALLLVTVSFFTIRYGLLDRPVAWLTEKHSTAMKHVPDAPIPDRGFSPFQALHFLVTFLKRGSRLFCHLQPPLIFRLTFTVAIYPGDSQKRKKKSKP